MCPFCGRSYKQLSSLKRHVKRMHVFPASCCRRGFNNCWRRKQ
ncbi:C2H2-type zinc finger protein [Pyrolobus fumarii]|nr:C2H2-type zinc finger protein [Pyrolobus fumarii]